MPEIVHPSLLAFAINWSTRPECRRLCGANYWTQDGVQCVSGSIVFPMLQYLDESASTETTDAECESNIKQLTQEMRLRLMRFACELTQSQGQKLLAATTVPVLREELDVVIALGDSLTEAVRKVAVGDGESLCALMPLVELPGEEYVTIVAAGGKPRWNPRSKKAEKRACD